MESCGLMRGPSPVENPLNALSFERSILSTEQKAKLGKLLSRLNIHSLVVLLILAELVWSSM